MFGEEESTLSKSMEQEHVRRQRALDCDHTPHRPHCDHTAHRAPPCVRETLPRPATTQISHKLEYYYFTEPRNKMLVRAKGHDYDSQ